MNHTDMGPESPPKGVEFIVLNRKFLTGFPNDVVQCRIMNVAYFGE